MAQHARDNKQANDGAPNRAGGQAARADALMAARKNAQGAGASPRPSGASMPAGDDDSRKAYPKGLGQFVMQNLIYILSAIAVASIIGLVLIIAAPTASEADLEAAEENSYVSPFDWMQLDRTGGRYSYVVDGQVKSRLGIDVSENQHEIDWQAVADDGIEFAMIRLGYRGATEGALYLDERYEANLEGARNAGIDCGVYFFSQAKNVDEAVEEADFVLEHLDGAQLEYPIAFDSEESVSGVSKSRTSGVDNDTMTAVADAFCNRVEEAGHASLVYGNAIDLSRYNRLHLETHQIWWAEYGMPAPTAKIDFVLWQYSNDGEVAGISLPVDMNIDLSRALD